MIGHAVGDAVLVAVSAALGRELREVDVVARWGGEEFLVLLPECGTDSARNRAEQLRRADCALCRAKSAGGDRVSVAA